MGTQKHISGTKHIAIASLYGAITSLYGVFFWADSPQCL